MRTKASGYVLAVLLISLLAVSCTSSAHKGTAGQKEVEGLDKVSGLDKPVVISDGSPLTLLSKQKWTTHNQRSVKPNPRGGKVDPDSGDTDTFDCGGFSERSSARTNAGGGGGYVFFPCGNAVTFVIEFTETGGRVHKVTASTDDDEKNLTIETDQADCTFDLREDDDHLLEYRRSNRPVPGGITSIRFGGNGKIPASGHTKLAINHH